MKINLRPLLDLFGYSPNEDLFETAKKFELSKDESDESLDKIPLVASCAQFVASQQTLKFL